MERTMGSASSVLMTSSSCRTSLAACCAAAASVLCCVAAAICTRAVSQSRESERSQLPEPSTAANIGSACQRHAHFPASALNTIVDPSIPSTYVLSTWDTHSGAVRGKALQHVRWPCTH